MYSKKTNWLWWASFQGVMQNLSQKSPSFPPSKSNQSATTKNEIEKMSANRKLLGQRPLNATGTLKTSPKNHSSKFVLPIWICTLHQRPKEIFLFPNRLKLPLCVKGIALYICIVNTIKYVSIILWNANHFFEMACKIEFWELPVSFTKNNLD